MIVFSFNEWLTITCGRPAFPPHQRDEVRPVTREQRITNGARIVRASPGIDGPEVVIGTEVSGASDGQSLVSPGRTARPLRPELHVLRSDSQVLRLVFDGSLRRRPAEEIAGPLSEDGIHLRQVDKGVARVDLIGVAARNADRPAGRPESASAVPDCLHVAS